jgi:RHS repeat-associated protein
VAAATLEYEDAGVTSATDAEGRETTFGYTNGLLTSITNPLQKTTTVHHDPATGDVDWVEDADGRRAEFQYNSMGWRTRTKNALQHETVVEYDTRGRVRKVTRPDGRFSEVKYDHVRNEVRAIGPDGRATVYKYDDAGRLAAVRDPSDAVTTYGYDAMSRLRTVRDDLGRTTYFFYHDKGQLEQIAYPGGTAESFTYDVAGRLQTKTDRRSVITTFRYDTLGRITRREFSDGTTPVDYAYDDVNHVLEVTQGTKRVKQTFDKAGWLLSEEQPHGVVAYDYFDDGNRQALRVDGQIRAAYRYTDAGALKFIDAGPRTFEYVLDAVGRRDALRYPNGIVTDYTLDDVSQLTALTIGLPGTPLQTWTYDRYPSGDLRQQTGTGVDALVHTYRYDPASRLVSDRVAGITPHASAWTYDSVGNRQTSQSGMDVTTAAHNQRNQLLSTTGGGALVIAGKTEPASRVELWMDSVERPETGALTATQQTGGEFDATFESVTPGPHTLTIEASVTPERKRRNRYTVEVTGDGATLSYDANGNLAEKTSGGHTWKYVWDVEGQLRHVCRDVPTCNADSATASFEYDPFGRRISKTAGGVTHTYVYDGADIVAEQVTGSTTATYRYVHGAGVDEPLAREAATSGDVLYYHADHLGTVRFLTDAAGAVARSYQYDAWGNITAETGAPVNGVEYAFTGREWDRETGLYYYRARYYDPKAGRFISEDPIGLAGGINLYEYAASRPTVLGDPAGLEPTLAYRPERPTYPGDDANLFEYWMYSQAMGNYLRWQEMSQAERGLEVLGGIPAVGVCQIHHVATNKALKSGWTALFKTIFDKAGMSLDDAINKLALDGHKGRHSPRYHQWVLDTLRSAVQGLDGADYKKALTEALDYLKAELKKAPDKVKGIGLP